MAEDFLYCLAVTASVPETNNTLRRKWHHQFQPDEFKNNSYLDGFPSALPEQMLNLTNF